jgi:hypothetical protein
MLLSPSCAFNRSTTEVWLEQVQEIYPCHRPQAVATKPVPRQEAIVRLRALQGQTIVECLKEQCQSLKASITPLLPDASRVVYGALAAAQS